MGKLQFMLGAGSSASGKTTLSMGLMRALNKRGYNVQPFKCGPDYIDTKHHAAAAGRPSVNLDTFLASRDHVKELYARYGTKADACVIEGVMGLYDGYDKSIGSSADTALLLDLPVILVVNSMSKSYSVAPLLYGLKNFNPSLKIAGVIFNSVSSERHYNILKEAAMDVGLEPLGFLRREAALEIPSQHLGLNIDSEFCFNEFADLIASAVEKTIDLDKIINKCTQPFEYHISSAAPCHGNLRISVARDEAFNFYFEENIEVLNQYGKVSFFSPINDKELPPTDFLYLPGGYPELHLPELSANRKMLSSIRNYCNSGGKTLAECGGMIYLCESLADKNGKPYELAGVLARQATIEHMKLTMGYRKVSMPDGREWRGHEFHYSRLLPGLEKCQQLNVLNAKGDPVDSEIIRYKNVFATYIHFYWGYQNRLNSLLF